MLPGQSQIRLANEQVPFAWAAALAGIASPSERGSRDTCPSCDEIRGLQIWYDHAWCHGCRTWFTPVRLLALTWDCDPETAAVRALKEYGYTPPTADELWESAERPKIPDRAALGRALVTWCAASIPGWAGNLEYERGPADLLAACLGLLPRVLTEEECGQWMEGCQQVMSRFLPGP